MDNREKCMDRGTEELDRLFYEESDMNVVFRSILRNGNIGVAMGHEKWQSSLLLKKCYPKKGIYTFYKDMSSRGILCVWRGLGFTASAEIFSTSIPENYAIQNIRITRYGRNGYPNSVVTFGTSGILGSASIWDEMEKLLVRYGYEPT